jgi:hypothetical protein
MTERPTWLGRHKYARVYISVVGGFILIVAAFLLIYSTLGPETLTRWIEGGAASQGVDISEPIEGKDP